MAEILSLKTKATKMFDYTTVDLSEFIPEYTPDEEKLSKDIARVLASHGEKISADSAMDGDMIMVNLSSEISRFNKENVMVPLGKGLFSKELEAQFMGRKVGEEFTAEADGKDVKCVITRSTRTILPELTDENVATFGMEGISSVKELKAWCVDRQIDRFLDEDESADMASAAVWRMMSENSEFDMDPDELRKAEEDAEIKAQELRDSEPVFETEEEKETFLKEYEGEYGVPYDKVDFDEFLKDLCHTELRLGAMGFDLAKREGKTITEDDYQAYIRNYQTAFPDMTAEEIMARQSREDFAKNYYNDIICKKLDEFVYESFKNKMNPYR